MPMQAGSGARGGHFGAGSTCSTGASPVSVAVGDFNKDGWLDIITANSSNTSAVSSGVVAVAGTVCAST